MKIEFENKIPLGELDPGSLFMLEDATVAFKTEYSTGGRPDCYIHGSGEVLHCGGVDLNELLVRPLTITSDFEDYEFIKIDDGTQQDMGSLFTNT